MIKAGAFDSFGKTRSTLLASYIKIMDVVADSKNKEFSNQITMFDIANTDDDIKKMEYDYDEKDEFSDKELLSMEKEMLGIYISGHPLEKYKDKIEKIATVNSIMLQEANDAIAKNEKTEIKDNQNATIVGIITSIKKKFTKNNKVMCFVTLEDLYGKTEVIVFESVYMEAQNLLVEENIVAINGRISVREDQDITLIASKIMDINDKNVENIGKRTYGNYNRNQNNFQQRSIENSNNANTIRSFANTQTNNQSSFFGKTMILDIRNLDEIHKDKLRGAIRFFNGEKTI